MGRSCDAYFELHFSIKCLLQDSSLFLSVLCVILYCNCHFKPETNCWCKGFQSPWKDGCGGTMLGWTFKSDYDIEFTPTTNLVLSVNNHDLSQTTAGNWGYLTYFLKCRSTFENIFERCASHLIMVLFYLPVILGGTWRIICL